MDFQCTRVASEKVELAQESVQGLFDERIFKRYRWCFERCEHGDLRDALVESRKLSL